MEGAAAVGSGSGGSSSLVFRGCHLPPGFRFQPTDQEIIVCYLKKKIAGTATSVTSIIADVDIYKFDPWDLPDQAMFGEGEWFFFSPRDRKYPNGARPNRTAGSGYWKATGTDKPILAAGGAHCLGVKKALVFYQGRSPKGTKTEWVMHEYRLLDTDAAAAVIARPQQAAAAAVNSMRLDDWVLCRVRKKGAFLGPADMDDETTTRAAVPVPVPATDHYHRAQTELEMTTAAAAAAHGREQVLVPDAGASFGDVVIDWPNNNNDLDDDDLLKYLIASGGLDGSLHMHHDDQGHGHGMVPVPVPAGASHNHNAAAPPPHHHHAHAVGLVSVLESIKRNLSFQAIDELYLMQPSSKRANYMTTTTTTMLSSSNEENQHHSAMSSPSPTCFSISDTDEVF